MFFNYIRETTCFPFLNPTFSILNIIRNLGSIPFLKYDSKQIIDLKVSPYLIITLRRAIQN